MSPLASLNASLNSGGASGLEIVCLTGSSLRGSSSISSLGAARLGRPQTSGGEGGGKARRAFSASQDARVARTVRNVVKNSTAKKHENSHYCC
jgi:hypothetical protein